jgi:hypothetical protein
MTELVATLKDRLHMEIRYSRGMQCIHRERYMEYLKDMREARMRRDAQRMREIAADLRDFTGEMWHLMTLESSAYGRLWDIVAGAHTPSASVPDATVPEDEEPANLIRLVTARPPAE